MDAETASLIVSPLAGIGGVGFGAWLSHKLSRRAVQEEREWASAQQVQTRKEEAAARLDAAVIKVMDECPQGYVDARNVPDEVHSMATRLMGTWTENAVLDDPEVERRFLSLNMTIGMARRARNWRRGVEEPQMVNLWPVQVAARELREALVYYQRRKPPPPAKYPTSKQLIGIVNKGGGNRFDAITDWLVDNEVG